MTGLADNLGKRQHARTDPQSTPIARPRCPLISNTSANPISGTLSNLPEDAIVTINGTNLQAGYEGGNSDDLTLTVALGELLVGDEKG